MQENSVVIAGRNFLRDGNWVLQQVANAIRSALTNADVGGRFGGDEFIVILYDESEEIVSMTASRIQEHVWSDAYLARIPVTLSIGGAAWQGTIAEYDAKSLLERADAALYQSKEKGRDCYTFLPLET